jgi:peptidoglycan/xylan/chitin deacetylase (PgdA/CDA1 family)
MRMPADRDTADAVPLLARLSHRVAIHIRTASVTLAVQTPLVSLTFDDAPLSACTTGADLLGAYGATGTYYIAGGLIGSRHRHWQLADEDSIARLHRDGHEIGCHTYSHAFLPGLSSRGIAIEAGRNAERLRGIVPDLNAKRALATIYGSSRGIMPGLNVGRIDRQFLKALPLIEGRMDADGIARAMDDALARMGWLIFYGHDVAEHPSAYGCSPTLLEAALRAATARSIHCIGVAEGLRRATT